MTQLDLNFDEIFCGPFLSFTSEIEWTGPSQFRPVLNSRAIWAQRGGCRDVYGCCERFGVADYLGVMNDSGILTFLVSRKVLVSLPIW